MDGVEVDSHVDCVNLKAIKKEEGFVTMHINGKSTEMKVDTGAKCNVMSLDTFRRLNSGKQLVKQKKAASLVAYGGTRIETSGIATLPCCFKEQNHSLPFFIVDRAVQPLLGFRACMDMGVVKMSLDIHQISVESSTDFSSQTYTQYKVLFISGALLCVRPTTVSTVFWLFYVVFYVLCLCFKRFLNAVCMCV